MCWGLKCKGEWGSDKGLCPLGSRAEDSFVTVKLEPPPFLDGVPLSWYTGFRFFGTGEILVSSNNTYLGEIRVCYKTSGKYRFHSQSY